MAPLPSETEREGGSHPLWVAYPMCQTPPLARAGNILRRLRLLGSRFLNQEGYQRLKHRANWLPLE